mmetsp:Transcript_23328/g.50586  ORF Transcript_23328/g.50586 Transcript_23328/m.50586 type:complete len:393 (+) Transcript_23328:89-1267(+)
MDYDIPVAHAQPLPPPVAPATVTEGFSAAAAGGSAAGMPTAQPLGDDQIKQLQEQGFTVGLAKALEKNNVAFPLRIWVVDNSGSMNAQDGNRIVATSRKDDVKVVPCTRWKELQGTIEYHVQMAALLQAPTIFRMLNDPGAASGPQIFGVGTNGPDNIDSDVSTALSVMLNSSPGGVTPLVQHIREIRQEVAAMAPNLTQRGQRVAIILATDGLPTDERGIGGEVQKRLFIEAMRSLEGLPVWIVVRLCTDDDTVVEFYNDLDTQLELSLEVLDDFISEGKEVYEVNKWLNYGLPLHRIREMGFHDRLFDLLEERKLTKDEVRDFCFLLFGADNFDGVPDAAVDFKGFAKCIAKMAEQEGQQWNPAKGKVQPWIRIEALKKGYADSSSMKWW